MDMIISGNEDISKNTQVGIVSGVFDNEDEIRKELGAGNVADVFNYLKEEVDKYYGESN